MGRQLPPAKMASVDHLLCLASDGIDGYNWYTEAAEQIKIVCGMEGWDADDFTGVLAAASPRVSVVRNIRLALHIMHHGDLMVIPMKLIRQSVRKFREGAGITGPKTNPFYHNLCGRLKPVTLDVWMAYAFDIKQTLFARKATHREACDRVTRVAKIMGIEPAEAQAAIWKGQRGRPTEKHPNGRTHSPMSVLDEYHTARNANWDIEGCSLSTE